MKLGCLPYLNVKPLVYAFEHGELPEDWELIYAPPSELAQMLKNGEIDAAPVSSFACFENPALSICPEICIAADGPVRSVLLFSKCCIEEIRSVALDTSSLSGANMLKIVLNERYGLQPVYVPMPPAPVSAMLDACDAALVIGNPAMIHPKQGLRIVDLAEEWGTLTGLPATFAVWAGPSMSKDLAKVLQDAKEDGIRRLPTIAREESSDLGLPYDLCLDYLTNVMIYDLGAREQKGLEMFRKKCLEHGLLESPLEGCSAK